MSQIIVHVGLGKTASTYLQKIVFPHLVEPQNYFTSATSISKICPWIYHVNDKNPKLGLTQTEQKKRLINLHSENIKSIKEFIPANSGTYIISSEGFVGQSYAPLKNAHLNAACIKKQFPNAKILLVLRNQSDYIRSLYNHLIFKLDIFTRYVPFDRFLDLTTHKCDLEGSTSLSILSDFSWLKLVSIYTSLFGAENILILDYELFKKKPDKFLEIIFKFYGFNCKSSSFTPKLINASITQDVSYQPRYFVKAKRILKNLVVSDMESYTRNASSLLWCIKNHKEHKNFYPLNSNEKCWKLIDNFFADENHELRRKRRSYHTGWEDI